MKNKLFTHLINKFSSVPVSDLIDGKENPDNAWYYNMMDSLNEVALITEQQQELDDEAYKAYAEKTKLAFAKLAKASEEMLAKGRDAMPKAFIGVFNSTLVANKAFSFFAKSLAEGNSLNKTLDNPEYLKGLFHETKPAEKNENYVPGQYSVKDMTLKQVLDTYIEKSKTANEILNQRLIDQAGDEEYTDEIIREKINLLADYLLSHENDSSYEDNKGWMNSIRNGYEQVREDYNYRKLSNLANSEKVFCEYFFDNIMEFRTTEIKLGNFDSPVSSFNNEQKEILKGEIKKLNLKGSKIGISHELYEQFEELSAQIQTFYKTLRSFQDCSKEAYEESSPLEIEITNEVQGYADKITAYIRGESTDLPSDTDINKTFTKLEKIVNMSALIDGKYKNYQHFVEAAYILAVDLAHLNPANSAQYQTRIAELKKTMQLNYLNPADILIKDPNLTEQEFIKIELGSIYLQQSKIIDRQEFMNITFIKMARNREYNKKMIEEAAKTIERNKLYIENKALPPEQRKKVSDLTSRYFNSSYVSEGKDEVDLKTKAEDAYAMYFMGKQIELEYQKLDKIAAGDKSIKNMPNLYLKDMMAREDITVDDFKDMSNCVYAMKHTKMFQLVNDMPIEKAADLFKDESVVNGIVNSMHKSDIAPLDEMEDKTLSALTQKSGNLFVSNSDSYQKIADGINRIFAKNASNYVAKTEDYIKLYNDCRVYSLTHDTVPFSSNGKLRANSVMEMMDKLAAKLSVVKPELAPKLEQDKTILMIRSKAYREAASKTALDNISKIMRLNKCDYSEGYNKLPGMAKKAIDKELRIITLAKGVEKYLKENKVTQYNASIYVDDKYDKIKKMSEAANGFAIKLSDLLKENPQIFRTYLDSPDNIANKQLNKKEPAQQLEEDNVIINDNIMRENN